MGDGRAVHILTREECGLLLAGADIGRVILTAQALPTALPVSYGLDGPDVIFRTSGGAKLSAASTGTVVAFEVDHFDPELRIGWSVVVTGVATVAVDKDEIRRLDALSIPSWVDQAPTQYVRLSTAMISGRRVAPHPAAPAVR
jgi:uncharacterized protein